MILNILFVSFLVASVECAYRRVCYYTNWSQYRNGLGQFLPANVDPNLCTHIIYSFAKLSGNNLQPFEWNDESSPWMKGMYAKVTELKKQNPNLKVLLAVGGWSVASHPFSAMSNTDASRRQFVSSAITFLRNHSFDGLDIDWEYPTQRGGTAADKTHFIDLLKALQTQFSSEATTSGNSKLLLTVAIPAGKKKIDSGYDIKEMIKYGDMFNLMSYDLHGGWDTVTGHNSGLYKHTGDTGDAATLNVDWVANYWVQGGMPSAMINVGLALYGRSFTLTDRNQHDLGSKASSAGDRGPYTRQKGYLAYYEICQLLKNGAIRHYLNDQMVPYAVNGSLWVGYEDEESIKIKVRYIKQHHFGGIMVWALDTDDFRGICGNGNYPLLTTINNELQRSGGPVVTPLFVSTQTMSAHTSTHNPTSKQHTTVAKVINTTNNAVLSTRQTQGSTSSGFSCAGKRDGFYANPASCDSYFICATHSPFMVQCASGLEYNAKTRFCDWPQNANCHNSNAGNNTNMPIVTGTPTSSPTQTPAGTNHPVTTTFKPIKLVFTPSQSRTHSTTRKPINLVFTPAATNTPNNTPAGTNQPTKLLVFTPAPTHSPSLTQAVTGTPQRTFGPIFTPAFTNIPGTQTPAAGRGSTPAVFNTNFCHGQSNGLHRDPNDCGSYYSCNYGFTFHDICPPGTAYNEKLEACDYPGNVPGCSNFG